MDDSIATLMDALPERINGDPHLRRIGRFCSTRFLVEAGESGFHLSVERGQMAPVITGPRPLRAWAFALRADPQVWQRFWEPLPAAGFNDIFALSRYGHMRIEGDTGPLLENLWYLKEVLAMPRQMLQESAP